MGDCGPFVFAVWCAECKRLHPETGGYPEPVKDGPLTLYRRAGEVWPTEYATYRWAKKKAQRHADATGHVHATVESR